jgi:hypothetical protein
MRGITLAKKYVITLLLGPLCSTVFSSQTVQAEEPQHFSNTRTIKVINFSNNLKVRGLEISKGVYMGQAKVAGKYGPGFVVKQKSFSWGFNHRGLSINKRF